MPQWFLILSLALLTIILLKAAATVVLAHRYHRARRWLPQGHEPISPRVTVLVPAYNEAATIANCLDGLSRQTYPHLDVLVVDDGSSDNTSAVAETAVAHLHGPVPVAVTRKGNGGKASALNYGILMTSADIVVCVDADSVLAPDAVERMVEPFADPEVGAVGGIVKVANRRTVLGRQQAMEYLAGLALQRAAFAELDAVQVLSGAISAFRRDAVKGFGGYSRETIVEDFDITIATRAAGYRVVLHPHAVAHTEGPLSLRDLRKQRHRWTYGGFQVLGKYRSLLFTDRLGLLSRVGLPYFLIFPWFDVAISVLFAGALVAALASGSMLGFVGFLAAMSVIVLGMNLYAVAVTGERKGLALWGLLSPLFYAHVLTWTTTKAGWSFLRGRRVAWDSLQRGGLNLLDEAGSREPTAV